MTRPGLAVLALALAWACGLARAAAPEVCPGDPRLQPLEGAWGDARVLAAAARTQVWPQAIEAVDPLLAGVVIRRGKVMLSLGWHELDPGGHCVRLDGEDLWLHPVADRTHPIGPYRRVAAAGDNEALAYLTRIIDGCFRADTGARWCFSRRAITVDGRPFDGEFVLDVAEMPEYGTTLVTRDATLPLRVLVPTADGFAIYRDDWVTADGHVPVVPGRDRPWRLLQRE